MVTPEQAAAATAAGVKAGEFYLSLFSGRGAGVGSATDSSAKNWFADGYSTVPGSMGGSPFSVIYAEGSKTPIYIESTKLLNKNYQKYKDAPGSKARNTLIDAEGNGTANVFFINDNSRTKWDLTGVSSDTTEVVGDFYISENTQSLEQRTMGGQAGGSMPAVVRAARCRAAAVKALGCPVGAKCPPAGKEAECLPVVKVGGRCKAGCRAGGGGGGGMPSGGGMGAPGGGMPGGMDSGTKGNFINATFQNSEWTGTVIGVSKNANLNFDEKSSWKATESVDIDTLTVASGTAITADKPVKITVAKLVVSGGGAYKAGKNVTIETRKEEAKEEAK